MAIEAWKLAAPSIPDSCRFIIVKLLCSIIQLLPEFCCTSYEVILFKVVFTLAFFEDFSCGEICTPSHHRSEIWSLSFKDISIVSNKLYIMRHCFKTDQKGRGILISLHTRSASTIQYSTMHSIHLIRQTVLGTLFITPVITWSIEFSSLTFCSKVCQP